MAEQISKQFYIVLNVLPHPVLKFLKLSFRYYRFNSALNKGKIFSKKYGRFYPNRILFVAGLPKSGTTWLENMLGAFPGYTIIPDPEITVWEYANGGSHQFELYLDYFQKVGQALAIVKVHCPGSANNVRILKNLEIPYVVMYRDLRDAAVSHVFYIKRTPWHVEYPHYKNKNIKSGLEHFGNTLLPKWAAWIQSWQRNRDKTRSIIVKYEEMKAKPVEVFSRIAQHYELPDKNIEIIVERFRFEKMKQKGSFFRKGKTGDWKNHFDDHLKGLFKKKVGQFLVQEGYEKDLDW